MRRRGLLYTWVLAGARRCNIFRRMPRVETRPIRAYEPAPSHPAPPASRSAMPHALVMMLLIILATAALTYVVPSGAYTREKSGLVVPGSFHTIPKQIAGAVVRSPPS